MYVKFLKQFIQVYALYFKYNSCCYVAVYTEMDSLSIQQDFSYILSLVDVIIDPFKS